MSEQLNDLARRMTDIRLDAESRLWEIVEECASILKDLRPNYRKPLLHYMKLELYIAQGRKCALGGEHMEFSSATVDHTIPFCYGGGNERSNIKIACLACNQAKGAEVNVYDLLVYLKDRYLNLPPTAWLGVE
jgi:5-methylcytosine-specific restriction endonuclease McrA